MKLFLYFKLIIFHATLGLGIFIYKPIAKPYFLCIVIFFLYKILTVSKKEKAFYILLACSYTLGAEVLLRMNQGTFFYEASKYLIIVFISIGFFYKGFHKKASFYLLYIFLLIPGVYVSLVLLDISDNIRKAIAFNLSGPVCLGVSAMFCYSIKITKTQLEYIISSIIFPLVSTVVYIFLYNPNVSDVSTGTGSNFASSGGFGPNQVATVLGLGMFLATVRFFYFSKNKWLRYLDLFLILMFSFRAIVTFSRGGVITAIIMIIIFVFIQYKSVNKKNKIRMLTSASLFVLLGVTIWMLSIAQTNGFIEKRYANQNAMGEEKEDITTGRKELFLSEFDEFINNPFFGVGVGRVKDLRFQKIGIHAASHNEISRIVSEHGLFGVLGFLILLFVPLFFRFGNTSNVLFYSFYIFWLLTINHSAMRIAGPAFIYALSLLNIVYEKPNLHRK